MAIGQPTQRFMTPLTAEAPSLRCGAVTMRCRTNLKKEKRLRNRAAQGDAAEVKRLIGAVLR